MKRLLPGLIAVSVLSSLTALADPPAAIATPALAIAQQVLDLGSSWADAEVRHDVATLRRILDDRFIATFGAGKLLDKEGFIITTVYVRHDGRWVALAEHQARAPPIE